MSRGRATTTHELAALRRMAAEGLTAAEADRALGRAPGFAAGWAQRESIRFRPAYRRRRISHKARKAAGRLRDLMTQLHAVDSHG